MWNCVAVAAAIATTTTATICEFVSFDVDYHLKNRAWFRHHHHYHHHPTMWLLIPFPSDDHYHWSNYHQHHFVVMPQLSNNKYFDYALLVMELLQLL
jgi:hypothetical protein